MRLTSVSVPRGWPSSIPKVSRSAAAILLLLAISAQTRPEIVISDNPALVNVDGLISMTSPQGLQIYGNDQLIDLNGLRDVDVIAGALTIRNNPSLADCRALAPVLGWPNGPPEDDVTDTISIYANSEGCGSGAQVLGSVVGPSQPVITGHTSGGGGLSLLFDAAVPGEQIFPVTGYRASCSGDGVDTSDSPGTTLRDNEPVTRSINVVGLSQGGTGSFVSEIEVEVDITHSDPTDLYITLTSPEGTVVVLWDRGSPGTENLIGTFPTSLSPVGELENVLSESMVGEWKLRVEDVDVGPITREGVLESWGLRVTEQGTFDGGVSSPFTIPNVGVGGAYSCSLSPVTRLGVRPQSELYLASLSTFPSRPVVLSTDYGDGEIILRVSVEDNGGADITGYQATCTDGTNTFTGTSTSSSITVSGLTNDVAYTCTVTATNSVGTSSASAATDSIAPEASSTGLPIWLLYQATQ